MIAQVALVPKKIAHINWFRDFENSDLGLDFGF